MVTLPNVTMVRIDRIDPPNPKPGEEAVFVVTVHFDIRPRYNTRIEMVLALPPCTDTGCEDCSESWIKERRTFTVPAYANRYTTIWRIRFDKPGVYAVCFGARVLGFR